MTMNVPRLDTALDNAGNEIANDVARIGPAVERFVDKASTAAKESAVRLREGTAQVRDAAVRVGDATVGYIKDEPVRSVLIAAAFGAALVAVGSLLTRRRH